MENPLLNLATLNAVSDMHGAIIIETLAKKKRASFKELRSISNLSNEGLQKRLETLQKYCIIKGELSDPEGGSYLFYRLTKFGEEFRSILHDSLDRASQVKPMQVSDSFVIDGQSFRNILDKVKLEGLKQIFDHSKIVLTDHDYSQLKELVYEQDNEQLEDFLNNTKQVIISSTYNDEEDSTKLEYHLRRAKKLSSYEARLVVTSVDTNASLITDNEKIQSAARSQGILCANSASVLELPKGDYLWEKFFELSLKPDTQKMNLSVQNNPIATLKKNYNKF